MPDPKLADYQWDATPRASLGAEALVGRGRFATGVRFTQWSTTQAIGAPSTTELAKVRNSTWELVGKGRVAELAGNELLAVVTAGRVHLGYTPDEITIPTGSGPPVVAELAPVNEWIWGGGVAGRRSLGRNFSVGLEIGHRVFRMTTAHRSGSAIVVEEESFGEWNGRLAIAWRHGRL